MIVLITAASLAVAVVLGWGFVAVWRRVVPADTSGAFWRSLLAISKALLTSDELGALLGAYKKLLAAVAAYVGRNLLGLALASLPAALVLTFAAPPVLRAWDGQARYVEVYSTGDAPLSLSGPIPLGPADADRLLYDLQPESKGRLLAGQTTIELSDLSQRTAFCRSTLTCLLFASLAFEVEELGDRAAGVPYIVVRPYHSDDNPLWPFLSDRELAFFAAFSLAALVSFIVMCGRSS